MVIGLRLAFLAGGFPDRLLTKFIPVVFYLKSGRQFAPKPLRASESITGLGVAISSESLFYNKRANQGA